MKRLTLYMLRTFSEDTYSVITSASDSREYGIILVRHPDNHA